MVCGAVSGSLFDGIVHKIARLFTKFRMRSKYIKVSKSVRIDMKKFNGIINFSLWQIQVKNGFSKCQGFQKRF